MRFSQQVKGKGPISTKKKRAFCGRKEFSGREISGKNSNKRGGTCVLPGGKKKEECLEKRTTTTNCAQEGIFCTKEGKILFFSATEEESFLGSGEL